MVFQCPEKVETAALRVPAAVRDRLARLLFAPIDHIRGLAHTSMTAIHAGPAGRLSASLGGDPD